MGDETPIKPQAPAPTVVIKKKKDEKYRKRDPRSWENIMRTTANMALEEKLQYMEKIYNELYNENRASCANLQARDKQYTQCLREHEKDRAELTKSILGRGQLESLCRELQKQNKLIKEENVARIKEEEDRRREVANTFTERLNALTSLITESKDKSNKVKDENQNMTQKLTELYEQYQQRENHLETMSRQLELQKKLAETQAKKVEIEREAERQTVHAQKRSMELQLEQYERDIVLLQEKNRSFEAQVDLYKSQYTDFETTMSKSNKVFDTFKEEMSRMSKQLHTLEAERNDLRKRWQSSVNSLIVLSEQHVALSNEQSALEKRLQMLQKLCRQLQEDRSSFLKQLKENNIEPIVPSLKNEDCKENEDGIHQEAVASISEATSAITLKPNLDKVKKVVKMSSSSSSSVDLENDPRPKASPKRPRKVHFETTLDLAPGSSGDQPSTSAAAEVVPEEAASAVAASAVAASAVAVGEPLQPQGVIQLQNGLDSPKSLDLDQMSFSRCREVPPQVPSSSASSTSFDLRDIEGDHIELVSLSSGSSSTLSLQPSPRIECLSEYGEKVESEATSTSSSDNLDDLAPMDPDEGISTGSSPRMMGTPMPSSCNLASSSSGSTSTEPEGHTPPMDDLSPREEEQHTPPMDDLSPREEEQE